MNVRLPAVLGAIVLVLSAAGGATWWLRGIIPDAPQAGMEPDALPTPPFPPRIAEGDQYDKCLTMLAEDPEGAEAIAAAWKAAGGGDTAIHCQALAAIAAGEPETGAAMLETLARGGKVQGLMRAVLLSQAAEARLMVDQAEAALNDTTEALEISPDDPDLLIGRANANDALGRTLHAMDDLNQALRLDATRADALVLRASVWRRLDMLPEARSDIEKAIALDPEDAETLLERGILRQRMGDTEGARKDWIHAREADPNSEAAELAAQNLTLLDAGPDKK
ncbi:MAG: hypothetical protein EXR07_19180 [Acetobacteraceae bacterium]|nr:hypothetical protein [Acetobacteraceae bacterium]